MAKIVKYCGKCDEGFAERFTFCPDCGSELQAYEMNPVGQGAAPPSPVFLEETAPEPVVEPQIEAAAVEEEEILELGNADQPAEEIFVAPPTVEVNEEVREFDGYDEDVQEIEVEEPEPEPERLPTSAAAFFEPKAYEHSEASKAAYDHDDDGYYITVIQDNNGKQRNVLLLGATFLVLTVAFASWGYSLFNKDLGVGSIGDSQSLAYLLDSVPMPIDEIEEQKKNDEEGGGGGGGGRDEQEPVSQGDLADQSRTPTRPPDAKVFRSDNFELKTPPPQTEGDRKFPKEFDRWGDPNSKYAGLQNGPGTGGGQGTGVGTGQGSGRGTGTGSGTGSGSGSGIGDGNGGGRGPGSGGPPPPIAVGPTTGLKIVAKPRPGYTEAARKNGTQGTVVLRVTFLANGSIGPISTVRGLPNGLTEQAIAAARSIRFEAPKRNGVPSAITRTIEYSFTMY
ncbi:MAG: energy transducer TonB [Acidobacteria bacterium]|nr:energy transducer TonB [Acidobacteriota bacterium]